MRYTVKVDSLTKKSGLLWLIFFLWPFLAFIFALITYRSKVSKYIVYAFLVLYGLTFVISFAGLDAYVYSQRLIANSERPFSDFWNIIGGIYANDTSVDIIEPFISFLVSRITSEHYLLFGTYAAIFAYFYLKSINLLVDNTPGRYNINEGLHIVFFTMINPIFNINGFRFWTATWIFFFGAYHVVLNKDRKYLLVALSSILVHFSFISAVVILLLYSLLGNRNKLYIIILLLSLFVPGILAPYLNNIIPGLGQGLQSRYLAYTNENYILGVEERSAITNWFVTNDFSLYYTYFAVLLLSVIFRKENKRGDLNNLFSFMLLFLSFINFGSSIPTMKRFQIAFLLFGASYIYLFLVQIRNIKLLPLAAVSLFPILLQAALGLRLGSESINTFLLLPMPFLLLSNEVAIATLFF